MVNMLVVLAGSWLLPGISVSSNWDAFIVAIVLGLLNTFIKPLLIIFTIPATIFTFGLFLLVINAVIILMTDWLVDGFAVAGFWWALLFSIILTIVNSWINKAEKKKKK